MRLAPLVRGVRCNAGLLSLDGLGWHLHFTSGKHGSEGGDAVALLSFLFIGHLGPVFGQLFIWSVAACWSW